jgi:porphobilinogen synthase
MNFPYSRLRRNRKSTWSRDLIAEVDIKPSDIILPLFVVEGKNFKYEIPSMPDVNVLSKDLATDIAKKAADLGIPVIALFPVVDKSLKSDDAKEAYNENNLICRTIAAIKKHVPQIGVTGDVALDPYTVHGHDGIVIDNYVDNDTTVSILAKQALALAKSGCDIVAPSDMMDGRVLKIRNILEDNKFFNTQIMSYAVKYASSLYGPFRNALGSNQESYLDKNSYQVDIRNSCEAMREISQDINEGADFIIIKPGMLYLDIIVLAKQQFNIPVIAYQVSGEYSMLKIAGKNNILDYNEAMFESLIAFKRAGASGIITYAGIEFLEHIWGC